MAVCEQQTKSDRTQSCEQTLIAKLKRPVIAGIISALIYGLVTVFAQDNTQAIFITAMSVLGALPVLVIEFFFGTRANGVIFYTITYSISATLWFFIGVLSACLTKRDWLAIVFWIIFLIGIEWISFLLMVVFGIAVSMH